MAKVDLIFKEMCQDILENGTSTEGEKVRPHWEDGSSAYTIKKFGVVNRYDLREEFPIFTLRRTALKSAVDEILWIWQKKSNNIHDLSSHIWDSWADEDGSIGKAYGYQMKIRSYHKDVTEEGLKIAFPKIQRSKLPYIDLEHFTDAETGEEIAVRTERGFVMDQVNKVIYDLKNTPFSRRIMTTLWNVADLDEMRLQPCAYSMTFNVTQRKGEDKLTLNAILNQRSQDVLAANNWNVVQYAALVHMFAQVCDMNVGELVHMIADAHIYDRHVPIIRELIEREPLPAPKLTINPEIKNFYLFTKEDFKLEGYQHGKEVKNIPIAI